MMSLLKSIGVPYFDNAGMAFLGNVVTRCRRSVLLKRGMRLILRRGDFKGRRP